MEVKIERKESNKIFITGKTGGFIESQSVEANLLFAVLETLEEIRCGLLDIEESIKLQKE